MTGSHDHGREASRKRLAVVLGLTTVYLIAEVVGASHDDVLARVREAVTQGLAIAHVTVQVERKGCEALETHL